MNEMNETNQDSPMEDLIRPMSPIQRAIGVFNSPQKTFEDIAAHPNWIFPLIVLVVASIIVTQILLPAIIADFTSSERFEKMMENDQIPIEQLESMRETQLNIMQKTTAIGAGVSTIISCVLVAAILLFIGNIIQGGSAKYKQLFSLYCWAGLVSLVGFVIRIPIGLQKVSMKIYFSPAVLFSPDAEDTVLFSIAEALDIFIIWRIILLALGFSAIYRFTVGKSIATVGGLYALLVAVGIAFGNFF